MQQKIIFDKLEDFIRKYYFNEVLRGAIFFVGLGLLYLLFTSLIEYFLWLDSASRTVIFWLFVGVEVFLFGRYLAWPLAKLFKIRKGINYKQASAIIGKHFSNVDDRLLNFLQLTAEPQKSELLLASIDQKAASLAPVPFTNAIDFSKTKRYLPLAILPILIVAYFFISGNSSVLSGSLNRVVRYSEYFAKPAPFKFVITSALSGVEGQSFTLRAETVGKVVPEQVSVLIGERTFLMDSEEPGVFTYEFTSLQEAVTFVLEANGFQSKEYTLQVAQVPSIVDFKMRLQYPGYLQKRAELVSGTGNAVVPEGTLVSWILNTKATTAVYFNVPDGKQAFSNNEQTFSYSRKLRDALSYEITTANQRVSNYERLKYQISVVKDQYPTINAKHAPDSLGVAKEVVVGELADDHGLGKFQIVYYPTGKPQEERRFNFSTKSGLYDRFVFTFPSTLPVVEGVSYEYYFEIFDNDGVNGAKSARSEVFSQRILTTDERNDQFLQDQKSAISNLEKSTNQQNKQLSELDKLQKLSREKDNLSFKDKQKLEDFIEKQQQTEEKMQKFAEKLKENLQKSELGKNDEEKKDLERRLEKSEKVSEETQKLLDELKELGDKLKQEDLLEKMDKLEKMTKSQTRNLKQLVEMTKRFYVKKKAEQLAKKLEELAQKQEQLAEEQVPNEDKKQEDLKKEFEDVEKQLEQLKKDNEELKAPLEIPSDQKKEESVKEDMNKAGESLKQDNQSGAKPKQKAAAKKMKEMSQMMAESMMSGESESNEEDAKTLRQILDNLLSFSFSEESLMKKFQSLQRSSPSYNTQLKKQQDLKQQFQHVDDSLFALSLRNPKIAEEVNKEIGEITYNIEKSLEQLVEGNVSRGTFHQQYTVSGSNKLADMLSETLNSMQMSMSGSGSGGKGTPSPGQGSGKGGQLPDIIQKQQGLGEKMGQQQGNKNQGNQPNGQQQGGSQPNGKEGGKSGSGKGEGESGEDGEGDAKAIMEIYKQQQQLREALSKELERKGMTGAGQNALNQMKELEKQLLNQGFKNNLQQRVQAIKQELLKLEKAIREQGEDNKRQSQTNQKSFSNNAPEISPALRDYLNSIEILNRQALPLRAIYGKKVQNYFSND
ncbi:hypothetical protein [Flavobacterium sp.]|uniref:hypothetical protein n=1 Tax=Flavobacterium sp. TaxID=239 RepID=UPI002629A9CA|nr:hypothetical protein [Flavobacterium sp.]